ncbi:hypothetical protein AAC387_Pa04g2456 [Persea americana]
MAEEEIAVAAAAEEVATDKKRKVDDLERDEAPEKDVSSPPPGETPAELEEPKADSNGVEESISKEEEVASELLDEREAKRPRRQEEIDDSGQQEAERDEVSQTEDLQHPLTENVQKPAIEDPRQNDLTTENIQQPAAGAPQQGDLPPSNIQQPASAVPQHGDLPSSNIQQPASEVPQQGHLPTSNILQPESEVPQQGDLPTSSIQQHESGVPQQVDLPTSNIQQPVLGVIQQVSLPPEQPKLDDLQPVSRKIEVPNNKVGVLIGKAGDTIRLLQYNSGARIQITRDSDADPYSSTRPVELIGTLENINKAEQLIKDVIAEADAGGSPALVARGFGTAQTGSEQIQIQVPYEKVGLIIGKGGENIKNLQTKSGARIQVILQNIPEGEASKERTVRITGNKSQIETARELIKEVMSQNPGRPLHLSGGFSQPAYRPRGPAVPPQWGPRVSTPAQPTSYPYQQGVVYPSQPSHYPPQTYSGYPQQQAPRSSFNPGWDQRPSAPVQAPPQSGAAYDHYSQGGLVTDPAPAAHIPAASAAAPTSAHAPLTNYNYGQPQGYGQPAPYPQSVPPQQSYGHDNQAPTQHAYGGHGPSQPGAYPQQVSTEPGYMQQPYNKPAYGTPSQGPLPQTYAPPPRASQPGDVPYQGPVPSAQSYGPQQTYPYASSGPQQPYPYGPTPTTNDGYAQPSSAAAPTPGYAPQGGPVAPGYSQQGGQPASVYAQQGVGAGGYGQYPSSQPGYGDQPAPNNVNYGYQGSTDAGYNSMPAQAYSAPASAQVGYVQPTSNQQTYDQSMPQAGYGSHPGTAPVGYAKSLSPQPGYNQYESGQMYGHH